MPTSYAVLDSGVLLATAQTEPLTPQAQRLVADFTANVVAVAAPSLMRYELVAVVRKWVYRGLATPQDAEAHLKRLFSYPVTLHFDDALLRRGYELATAFNRPTAYDAQYLALAERLSCDFWTADERLFNAVSGQLPSVKWVGSF